MALTVFPAPSTSTSDNYVLISSVSPSAGASTVSFTSISGYRKLILRFVGTTLATASAGVRVTFNGDSGTNYAYARIGGTTTQDNQQTQVGTSIDLANASSTSVSGATIIIDNANTTGIKTFSGFGLVISPVISQLTGVYVTSSAISTVTLTTSTTFSGAGTVALYGVAA